MPCYTAPKSYELVLPSANNCQPPQNKLRTESINSGDIHSIYDTTLLTGNNRLSTTTIPIWISPKTSSKYIVIGNFVVNTDGTIASSVTVTSTMEIFDSSISWGDDSFAPDPPIKTGTFSSGGAIVINSPIGNLLKVAGIGNDTLVNAPSIIKCSDGGYYFIVEGSGDVTIFDAGTANGTITPLVVHTPISMGALNFIVIVKYSSELVAEWTNFITNDTASISLIDYSVDESDNLVILSGSPTVSNFGFYGRTGPNGPLPSPLITMNVTLIGYTIAKFSNQGVLQLINKVDMSGTKTGNDNIIPSTIECDNTGAIITSFVATVSTGNYLNIYNSGSTSSSQPELSGTFDSNMATDCVVIVKYDSRGKVQWVNKNDINNQTTDHTNVVLDRDNNIYINYDVHTSSSPIDQTINGLYTPPPVTGTPFTAVRVIGTIPAVNIMNADGDYETIIKYDSAGDFKWLSVVAGLNGISISTRKKMSILLRSGDLLISCLIAGGAGNIVKVYKRSLAPTVANIGDDGGPFTLEVDILTPPVSSSGGSIVVRLNSEGDNVWASMYDMVSFMIAEDPTEGLYCTGFFIQNDPARIYNAGTSQQTMTRAGTIPVIPIERGITIAMTSAGIVKWVHIIESTNDSINRDVRIDVSTPNIIIAFEYPSSFIVGSVSFSNRITPLGDGNFSPFDSAGSINKSGKYGAYLANIGGFSTILAHPSYNLLYPNNNNKTIVNTTTSDAVIYGRGLLINKGVRVYEAMLGPGAIISLLSIVNGCRDGRWIVVETYGDVKFA